MSLHLRRRLKLMTGSLAARCVRRSRLTAAQLTVLRPQRILIVRQHNQMGDMVCATPSLRAIKETFPAAELALVTSPVNVEVVRHNPHLGRVFVFDRKSWRRPGEFLGFVRTLRNYRADLAFVLCSVSWSVTSAGIALASGARHVVGAASLPFGLDISRHAFSLEMPSTPTLDRHAVDHSLAPLEAVGITTADRTTVVVPASAEKERARSIATDLGLAPGFWALHPGAGKEQNLWPADRFAEIARRAVAAGRQVLILHGPADAGPLAAMQESLGDLAAGPIRVAPSCPVGVGAALLQLADRFLCNDTGVMHMAGAVRAPTLALFGPTDPALWKPPAAEVVALRSDARAADARGREFGWMESIATDTVWQAWQGLTGRIPEKEAGSTWS